MGCSILVSVWIVLVVFIILIFCMVSQPILLYITVCNTLQGSLLSQSGVSSTVVAFSGERCSPCDCSAGCCIGRKQWPIVCDDELRIYSPWFNARHCYCSLEQGI